MSVITISTKISISWGYFEGVFEKQIGYFVMKKRNDIIVGNKNQNIIQLIKKQKKI